jgi:hypothetical protein
MLAKLSTYQRHNSRLHVSHTSTALGRDAHTAFDYGPGIQKEFRLLNGLRPDAISFEHGIVFELKPNNARKIREGMSQVSRYLDQLEVQFPQMPWSGQVVTY